MEDDAILLWVLDKVSRGELYDKEANSISIPEHAAQDPILREAFNRLFFRQFAKAVVAAHPSGDESNSAIRADNAYKKLTGVPAKRGMPEIDDTDALMDMFEASHDGLPIELFYSVDSWDTLIPPPDIELAPLARDALKLTNNHSEISAVARLVDKFKERYLYLAARYIIAESINSEVGNLLDDVAMLLRSRHVGMESTSGFCGRSHSQRDTFGAI
jgi:hypothetical protein